MEAGEALVAEGGFDAAGIAEIAKRADSSVGTFYRLIGDKDALLGAVHDRFVDYGRARIAVQLAPELHTEADLKAVLESFVRLIVGLYIEREGMLRALIIRSSANPEFRERIQALRQDIRAHLGALILPRAHQIHHPRPLEASAFALKIVLGTLNYAAVVASIDRESPEDLVRELTAVLVRYLEVQ